MLALIRLLPSSLPREPEEEEREEEEEEKEEEEEEEEEQPEDKFLSSTFGRRRNTFAKSRPRRRLAGQSFLSTLA